ncbi:hypothetical protein V8C35DRAFT_318252 [Trichoderma chlorosporum]
MDEIQNKDAKVTNQAWRKRPRKFAPKSRLGCKTCKIRRVKCDLSQPSCLRCESTGRTCDGYPEMPLAFMPDIESSRNQNGKSNREEGWETFYSGNMTSAYQLKGRYHGPISYNLTPLMILPVTGSAQNEAMWFFEHVSIKHLNEYRPCDSWRKTLMFFAQTVPSVRHAATALALINRNYLDRDTTDRVHVHQLQSLKDWPPDKVALTHYNLAIQHLLNQATGGGTETIAITLLVCYLFTCFDQLAGNYVQATRHLHGGVELLRSIDKAILNSSNTYEDAGFSGARTLICQVTRQIRRLDMQAVIFLVDWTPMENQETLTYQSSAANDAFRSLDQAADHLQILIGQVMGIRNTEQQMFLMGSMPSSPSPMTDLFLGQLETWLNLFENMLQRGDSYGTDSETYASISLLRLQHTIAWTLLQCHGPGREMEYDNHISQFQKCVALVDDVAAAHEQYSGSLNPTFTPEIGIIPVLYIIGVKCRHPAVRREVLTILRRQPMREAVWDSIIVARVIERVIEIEESGVDMSQLPQATKQIAMCQRIEALSWVQVISGNSTAKVDINYTFCARKRIHVESLTV